MLEPLRCGGSTPFAFGCLGGLPSGCVQSPDASTIACASKQNLGTCAESSGCACQHCAPELRDCANEYACVFVRGCSLGIGNCDPNTDPYFRGYGDGAALWSALQNCMTTASCVPKCP